jgi:hypothetical protein
MVKGGLCSMYLQHYIRVISLVKKGRDYSEEDKRHSDKGSSPKEYSRKGSSPKDNSIKEPQEETDPFLFISKGER